jgi:hypothetical protein
MLRVGYVDRQAIRAEPSEWPRLPSEGVDFVELENGAGSVRVSGHSLYWLYLEGDSWVIGGGSIGYANPLGETVVGVGNHQYRAIEYMPDLAARQVKLGHWWPGKERPPHG